MSLTSHLKHKGAVYSWMRVQFPIANRMEVLRECRPLLKTVATHLPTLKAKADFKYPYALFGTAIDYRLRLHFAPFPERLVAHHGALILKHERARLIRREQIRSAGALARQKPGAPVVDLPPDETDDFFAALGETVARLAPAGRQLCEADEVELGRYCFVLAHLEALYRAGSFFDSPLRGADRPQKLSDFLDLCPLNVAKDMAALSRIFGENCGDLIALGADVRQNPTFVGSSLIGGADADFIASNCLCDIKTTIRAVVSGEWIYQLLGYVLLDFKDEYRIREVGIYLARQGLRLQRSVRSSGVGA